MNTEEDKLLGSMIVSNMDNVDMFRMHIFSRSIRFDPHFAEGLLGNEELFRMIMAVDEQWRERKITKKQIFAQIVFAIEKFDSYIRQFYFTPDQLDEKGKFKFKENTERMDKMYLYYNWLKAGEKLRKITKREFERSIKDEKVANYYVDNYPKRGAKFYTYNMGESDPKSCYLMVVKDRIKIGFVSEPK